MSRRIQLLIIDPQNDFCDLPPGPQGTPALPVAGADADMQRLARFMDAAGDALSEITVTLDSHHRLDIAHPSFWWAGDGSAVTPFTAITAAQVRAGAFRPRDAAALPRTLAYLDALETAGRYTLMVWPVHCEIGSWGHNVHADVRAAYNRWEERRQAIVQKVTKGENPWTEHYSAVQAEVPDEGDAHTRLNRTLIDALDDCDLLLIAGEASSHCVKATTEHIVEHLPGGRLQRLVLLSDCMSPVGGFEAQANDFLAAMQARGVRLATSTDALALLKN
ncbi:cysteine hydrolase [Aquabacterium sp.]|uniref:cysteine hydrolase n=1 Tax=Aquabacterium sp. TaxID=1872578 RepID=UPI002D1ACD90|nr:cysteine hydrolase [Aquabacterium sp.]HSW05944.1 cysteine hydrolase [Aquabacterium sp.]